MEVANAQGLGTRAVRTGIAMLAGIGLLYLAEIFQIASRINAATMDGYAEEAYAVPHKPNKSR